jgi:hypothetical protein
MNLRSINRGVAYSMMLTSVAFALPTEAHALQERLSTGAPTLRSINTPSLIVAAGGAGGNLFIVDRQETGAEGTPIGVLQVKNHEGALNWRDSIKDHEVTIVEVNSNNYSSKAKGAKIEVFSVPDQNSPIVEITENVEWELEIHNHYRLSPNRWRTDTWGIKFEQLREVDLAGDPIRVSELKGFFRINVAGQEYIPPTPKDPQGISLNAFPFPPSTSGNKP